MQSKSYSACKPNQNFADVPKNLLSRIAVSGVMARFPWTISLMRRGGTPIWRASSFCDKLSGSKNSSFNTSPGWTGFKYLSSFAMFKASICGALAGAVLWSFPTAGCAPLRALTCGYGMVPHCRTVSLTRRFVIFAYEYIFIIYQLYIILQMYLNDFIKYLKWKNVLYA